MAHKLARHCEGTGSAGRYSAAVALELPLVADRTGSGSQNIRHFG